MFCFRNEKKKRHPLFPFLVGALAVFGAYSAVCTFKEKIACGVQKMRGMLMKRGKGCECAPPAENALEEN